MEELPDLAEMSSAATFNTMISSHWLKAHSDIRFDPHFGVVGGEDMVFFRSARAAGLSIRFSERGYTYENEPPDRATFGYQLCGYFWHGNSAALSSIQSGMSRGRMLVHGVASFVRALVRPLARLSRGSFAPVAVRAGPNPARDRQASRSRRHSRRSSVNPCISSSHSPDFTALAAERRWYSNPLPSRLRCAENIT